MKQAYHILNGDFLTSELIHTVNNSNVIVCRECLIDGEVDAKNLGEFWSIRAKFIAHSYNETIENYYSKVVSEFDKIKVIPPNSEVCLWFENDLFCQINLWFMLYLLKEKTTLKLYRIFPIIQKNENKWIGFGNPNVKELKMAYKNKVLFSESDRMLSLKLWEAFQKSDFKKLKELSIQNYNCFEYLEEVCQAHIDRFPVDDSIGLPQKLLNEIITSSKSTDFESVFSEFSEKFGIFGFGDLQLKRMYNQQMKLT
jgi:hypothetical protein